MSEMTGFYAEVSVDTFCTAFGVVEELRAFPERLAVMTPENRRAVCACRQAFGRLAWIGVDKGVLFYTPGDFKQPDRSYLVRLLSDVEDLMRQLLDTVRGGAATLSKLETL